jgi:glycosyltransferase involved in cell wall biosynthesis
MNGAVITALNEAGTIAELVYQLKRQGLDVCVVNDGSTDDTGKVAELAGAHVITHDKPRGIGKSLVEAWRYAIIKGWRYTVQIDAGGSHDPNDDVHRYIGGDIVIGSRFLEHSAYLGGSKWRKMGSYYAAKLLNFASHQKITDWTSGYRVFSLTALRHLVNVPYMTNMHTWQIEVLHEANRQGLTVSEAPITYRATNSTFKLSMIDDLIKVYLWVLFT